MKSRKSGTDETYRRIWGVPPEPGVMGPAPMSGDQEAQPDDAGSSSTDAGIPESPRSAEAPPPAYGPLRFSPKEPENADAEPTEADADDQPGAPTPDLVESSSRLRRLPSLEPGAEDDDVFESVMSRLRPAIVSLLARMTQVEQELTELTKVSKGLAERLARLEGDDEG